MTYLDETRATLGWVHLSKIIDYIASANLNIDLVYLFETHELVITDPKLITILDDLGIKYTLDNPMPGILFIKSLKKE